MSATYPDEAKAALADLRARLTPENSTQRLRDVLDDALRELAGGDVRHARDLIDYATTNVAGPWQTESDPVEYPLAYTERAPDVYGILEGIRLRFGSVPPHPTDAGPE